MKQQNSRIKVILQCVMLTTLLLSLHCSRPSVENASKPNEVFYVNSRGVQLYYLENNWIVKVQCPQGTILVDHAHCTDERETVPAPLFYQNLFKAWGGEAVGYESQIVDLYIRLTQIDARLREFIDVSPTPPVHGDILTAIHEKEITLADVEREIVALKDQQARIDEALRSGSGTDDLRNQMVAVQNALGLKRPIADGLRTELAQMRLDYINDNATLIDEATFNDLSRQRDSVLRRVDDARDRFRLELTRAAESARAIQRLEDHFAFDYTFPSLNPGSHAAVSMFAEAFSQTSLAYTFIPFVASNSQGTVVAMVSDHAGVVDEVNCRFEVMSGVSCQGINLSTPYGVVYSPGLHFEFETSCSDCGVIEGRRLLGRPVNGNWVAQLACSTNLGSIPNAVSRATCKMKVKW